MDDIGPTESVIFTALQELLARFEADLIAGEDVVPLVREMVLVAGRSTDPGRWSDALTEELRGYLSDLWPEGDEEPPPMLAPCLDAVCEFVLLVPCPELAWLLLVRLDPETGPEPVIADMSALLAMGDTVETETRAEALMVRADAERERGTVQSSVADWVEAYGLSEDPKLRIACATELAVALADREELVDAAEWAWRAGLLVEETEPDEDQDFWNDVIAAQAVAIDHLHAANGPIEQIRALIDRILARPHWWPEGTGGTDLSVLAASAAVQDNDIAGALDHLAKARLYWDEADESVRADWQLTRGETGVIAGDPIAVERAVRSAEPWIRQAGSDEQRGRFEVLVRCATGAAGSSEPGTADDVVKVLNDLVLRIRSGVVQASELELIDRTVAECEPAVHGPLIVSLYAIKAMVLATLKRVPEARQATEQGRTAYQWLQEAKPGGYPQQIWLILEMADVMIELADGRPDEAARMLDASWRKSQAAGSLAFTSVGASAAAYLHLKVLRQPQEAFEAAVVALTAAQELECAKADSSDRLAFAGLHGDVRDWAIEAAEELRDARLMAELLEVLRAQAVPYVSANGQTAGPLGSLLGAVLTVVEPQAEPATPGVELPPPPYIVMPWGSIALARWLSYPPDVERDSGRVGLDPVWT
ncbi:hypothetical protein OHA70_03865 [Kribbella sp. NBC_00382]|uniref:hypothetical protein n=1 Tax=Kribbella sp. NBC_00382 TaxID=2975967 RepID=UPI002E200D67